MVALIAGALSGIIGFGASIILLPLLALAFGGMQAVPVMAIAAVMANLARLLLWWQAVDWRACFAFAVTAAPAAAIGARTLLELPRGLVETTLGVVFLAMIPLRHYLLRRALHLKQAGLLAAGAVIGLLTGVVASTGPISVPVFLAYGLTKGAFIGTEAAASLAMYGTKVAVFDQLGALPMAVLAQGLTTGAALMAGTWIGKRWVVRMDQRYFQHAMDCALLIGGGVLLAG